jgi:hypothetical protein
MSNSEPISIILSPAQVDQVVRAAAQDSTPSFSALITTAIQDHHAASSSDAQEPRGGYFPEAEEDARLSRSLLRGLSILTYFGPDNRERGIIELAGLLRMSPSTTHRYVATLVELGLLERSPRTRKYRLARVPSGSSPAEPAESLDEPRDESDSAGSNDAAPLAQPSTDD